MDGCGSQHVTEKMMGPGSLLELLVEVGHLGMEVPSTEWGGSSQTLNPPTDTITQVLILF